ncbi:MAG: outer membrane protein assembly factor BamA [Candidatus Latescibacteria bacterium]|nr:outer membrane protein assembly factor BamA [Candidatus Latescibacterota bacterium]NIM20946.1 outer membrane protein assembly factor BamA [Candidatus Latescibacterota bacterium]NIM65081.1 outer membrane protein assembly factor BamA [Candidatus Latescibacterota bacterium]NIO01596.1 outer membrane protein assembly factor BamA [Candidatus Latescibacterota bacterium]NIO28113.1 outer membrane protein assembly factor BamA [Candidatus Latescibacterota bacterium]
MKKTLLQIIGCTVLLHLFSFAAVAETRVESITVHGNYHVSLEKIFRILRLKVGDPYSEDRLEEALKRLFATKEFSDIQAYKETTEEGIALLLIVKEYLKVDEVEFEGNEHANKEDLDKAISMRSGSFARPALIRKDHEAIADIYRDKGYYRVAVSDTVVYKEKEKKIVLQYKITEGSKVSIKHIDFFGNKALDSDEIRKVIESKEDRWWRGADFKPKVFEEDSEKILNLHRQHGFLDAEIQDKELIFSEDGKDLDIFITVSENKQYRVGEVTWQGNKLFEDSTIAKYIAFNRGEVFNEVEFQETQFGIGGLYADKGYIFSSVSPVKNVRGDTIDVDFEIVEGKPAHVREINILGNTKTAEEVIRRELIIKPGEVFSRPRLMRSLREVFNLGFFNGPPQVNPSPPDDNGDISLSLQVEERSTGQFRFGAGFSALNKISGFLGIEEPNFLGKGQRIGLNWEFSSYRQNLDLRFTEPWLLGTPTELSVSVFNIIQNQVRQQFYDDRRKGFSIRIGRPFPWFDYTSVFGRYQYESVELKNFSDGYTGPLTRIQWPQRTSSVAFTLTRNSTDSPFHPTMGTWSTVTAEWNGGDLLGGDVRFQRYEASLCWYATLLWKFVLDTHYNIGVLDGYDSPSQVPDYELFRLGGNRRYALRGYDFYEVVPRGNPQFIGGRFMQTLSYEISFPIAPSIYGLFFLDGGNTWNSFRGADLFDLKKGAGIGIRLELPMLGTVGLDYGYGFDKEGGGAWEPHISLGAFF